MRSKLKNSITEYNVQSQRNPYQDIVNRYKNKKMKYRGSQTFDNSISSMINKIILWSVILLQFVSISMMFVMYIAFVSIQNNTILRIWILGGLDDLVFHWALFSLCTVFSLLLCSFKNQVYYYYILWILFAIHSIWDAADGIFWAMDRNNIVDYHGQVEGYVFYFSIAYLTYLLIANFLVIILSILGTINLPVHYIPITDFGKWVKSKQLSWQKFYIRKAKISNQKYLKKMNRKNIKLK